MSDYPSDWTRTTFGNVLKQRKEAGFTNEELLAVTSSLGIVRRDTLERRDTSNEDKSKYLLVEEGDIAYNTMRMWQGVSGVSRFRGIVSPAYTICTPTEGIDKDFAGYLLKDPEMISIFRQRSQGLVSDTWNLKYESFAQIPCTIPPLPEQKKTAEILSGIDSLILKSEMRIQKLQFSHSSFSAEAFCIRPGLDSQEVALGDIVTLRHGYQFRTPDFAENGAKVIKISQVIGDGVVIIEDCDRVPWTLATEKEKFRLNPGDVLMSLTGNIGRVGIVPDTNEVLLQNYRVGLFAPSGKNISREYMIHLLESRQVVSQLEDNSNASAQANFGKGDLDKIMVYLPEAHMQVRMASFLSSSKDRIMKEKRKVEVFRKMKQSISSELLSGRKRVSI